MAESRKTLKIDPAVHRRLKIRAAQLGISMADLIDLATKEVLAHGVTRESNNHDLPGEKSLPK